MKLADHLRNTAIYLEGEARLPATGVMLRKGADALEAAERLAEAVESQSNRRIFEALADYRAKTGGGT